MASLVIKSKSGTYGTVHLDGVDAIKSIKYDLMENAIKEILFLKTCNHGNIVNLKSFRFGRGGIYLVMDKYQYDLQEYTKGDVVLPPTTIYKFVWDILNGLNHIHENGIIHCDVKPANILIEDTTTPRAIICDFSIATITQETFHDDVAQTPDYRAPEVDVSKQRTRYTTGVDVWGLGCVMYWLLTKRPFLEKYDNDSTIPLCGLFGLDFCESRQSRLRLLRGIHLDYIYRQLCQLLQPCERRQCFIDSGYVMLMAKCLHFNHRSRITVASAMKTVSIMLGMSNGDIVLGKIKGMVSNKQTVQQYDPDFLIGIPPVIAQASKKYCVVYADKLMKSIKTDITIRGQLREKIKLGCLYIATCRLSSHSHNILNMILYVIPQQKLTSVISFILSHISL